MENCLSSVENLVILKIMQIYSGVSSLKEPLKSSVVTIGNFDGVHLGHRQLIETVVRESRHFGVPSVVYTFFPHPVKVLKPETPTYRLFDLEDQQERFADLGIEQVVIEPFTLDFAKVSAQDFLDNYLVKYLNPQTLVVGHDFNFGADRSGNLRFLEEYCAQKGIRLIIIPPFSVGGTVASSSKIREFLKAGDVEKAAFLLDRSYYLRGKVEKGFQRGRTIGVPTANLSPDVEFTPRLGVYITETHVGGGIYPSITNIGINPTFSNGDGSPIKIETHIFDFAAHLYDVEIEVFLLHFIRDEKKFSSVESLVQQIHQDMDIARKYFDEKRT